MLKWQKHTDLNRSDIENQSIDVDSLRELFELYGENIPDIVKKIAIRCKEDCFFEDGRRLLSYYEVCHADDEYDTNFVQNKLIPLIDMSDNDFIVYDMSSNLWLKYNIVDYISFEESSNLSSILHP